MLLLKLFGSGQATYNDAPLLGFPNQQSYLLFCYLIIHQHTTHSRAQLAQIFWGEYELPIARKYLRNALWRLRRALEQIGIPFNEYILIEGDTISFLNTYHYWLDIERFETLLNRYKTLSGIQLSAPQAAEIEAGIDLYHDDLLEGIFADWCIQERERLHLLYLTNLNKLINFHEQNNSFEEAIRFGTLILAQDNSQESIHRQMMRLYCQAGNQRAALEQYQQCVHIVQTFLQRHPEPETERLYQQILHQQYQSLARPTSHISPELVKQALQRVQTLQSVIEQVGAELQELEQLFKDLQ